MQTVRDLLELLISIIWCVKLGLKWESTGQEISRNRVVKPCLIVFHNRRKHLHSYHLRVLFGKNSIISSLLRQVVVTQWARSRCNSFTATMLFCGYFHSNFSKVMEKKDMLFCTHLSWRQLPEILVRGCPDICVTFDKCIRHTVSIS